ncbi:endonuclease/exonuclease/phosphatase family metal-dependent hydrolase [Thermonema lapsum]|uniref:Endonuclease/exonuclease/phosphatase family metal-dependent hydrolase n=1 Tax=Thermonema lapsum TaxID=28195 RepID=A0A846MSE2_9BACT|nr:endonuclease/exonuclease/phosphatase family protein [Thermonema lapsum]NIK74260.1 endonuclease/exonuclease/phosphatase family metal-dependent hydrolase [Thermonema lapsum]
MKRIRYRLVSWIFLLYSCFGLLCYASLWIPPNETWWWSGFLSLLIPAVALSFLLWLLFWMPRRQLYACLSVACLLAATPALNGVFQLNWNSYAPSQGKTAADMLSIMSYNVRVFNVYEHLQAGDSLISRQMIQWVSEYPAQIKCLQEIYNEDSSEVFNTVEKIAQKGKYNYYLAPLPSNNPYKVGYFGMGIFSVYPIVHSGFLELGNRRSNRAIFIDIVHEQDTVRIYNVHLASMSIDISGSFSTGEVSARFMNILRKLKEGFIRRTHEQQILLTHIRQSPYPVIVCGDFNALPHSYTYWAFKKTLSNAFEEAGTGFGFTYSNPPLLLRIDHQFFDDSFWQVVGCQVLRQIPYSDHHPLVAIYQKRSMARRQ